MGRGLLIFAAAAGVSGLLVGTASPRGAIGPVKACVYTSFDDVIVSENVKVSVAGAAHARGTFTFKGAGLDTKTPFKLDKNGGVLTSFPVNQNGTVTILITLATHPPRTARLGVKVNIANQVDQQPCTPK